MATNVEPVEQDVTVAFGKANFPAMVANVAAMRLQPPFIRDSAASSGRRVRGSTEEYLAGTIPHYGTLYRQVVAHRQGAVLLLSVRWQNARGVATREGVIMLKLRNGAARLSISAKLPREQANVLGHTFVMFEGNADILTEEELAEQGFRIPVNYAKRFMCDEEIDECFEITQVAPATLAKPKLLAVEREGKKVLVEVATAPARRINLRRR